MPDIDSPLDTRLQSFFEEIKAQGLPGQLAAFKPGTARTGRRLLNLFAGAAGIAVVAAGVAAFAVELNGHHDVGSLIPGGQSSSSPMVGPTPPFRPSVPTDAHGVKVLIPVTYGTGPKTLPTVVLGPNEALGYEYGCISDHPTTIATTMALVANRVFDTSGGWSNFLVDGCSNPKGASAGSEMSNGGGGILNRHIYRSTTTPAPSQSTISLRVKTEASVNWVVLVYEFPSTSSWVIIPPIPTSTTSSSPAPSLAPGVAPPGATVLVPLTYGTGPATLPTFTWAPNDMLYIADGCGSGVIGDTVTFAGDNSTFDGDFVTGQCSGPVTLAGGSGTSGGAGGPVSLTVKAGASLKWAVFIYEAPPGLLGPAP